jgi:hypothetical protein
MLSRKAFRQLTPNRPFFYSSRTRPKRGRCDSSTGEDSLKRTRPRPEFFLSLYRKSKGPSGEMIRIRGLEWLRLESLRRADLTSQEKETYRDDLQHIRYRRHHRLIDPRRKAVTWVYPYRTPPLGRAGAIEYVSLGSRGRDPRRLYLSIDPTQPEKTLIRALKEKLKATKATRRSRGAGRRYPLSQMWEALQLYDLRKAHDVPLKELGFRSRTPRPLEEKPDNIRAAIKRGGLLLNLATQMIDSAKHSPAAWLQTFL